MSASQRSSSIAASTDLGRLVRVALAEDVGRGDVTAALVGPGIRGKARFVAKQAGVASGLRVAAEVFRQLEPGARFRILVANGDSFGPGDVLAEVTASVRTLLTGERTALNFVQQLSGVATLTRRFVEALGNDSIGVYDTRKTVPLLRRLQKEAVLHGTGRNHRMGLYDMAMIKNNHVDACGGVGAAVMRLGKAGFFRKGLPLCIEVRDDDEAIEATAAGADIVMLDNMTPARIRRAAALVAETAKALGVRRPDLEVSGGVNLKTIARMRGLPIQRISVGAITHSAPAVDMSLRITAN